MTEELLPFCECGECGLRVTKKGNRFIKEHSQRGIPHTSPAQIAADKAKSENMRDVPLSPDHCAAISAGKLGTPRTSAAHLAADDAKRGVPLSPEHCAAISTAKLGVPHTSLAQIAADEVRTENMRGGNDLVNHHYLYDHADLSLNTVQMTRSDHGKLHRLLQKLAYIVPHINVKGELNE